MTHLVVVVVGACLAAALASPSRHSPLLHAEIAVARPDPAITLTTDTTRLHRSGQWLTASWAGVPDPQPNDWIGLYSPADADVRDTAPVKLQWAGRSATH